MKYRIGIDLGTNSLGWAAIELRTGDDGKLGAGPLLDIGVRIFSDARNPKDKSSNASQRRELNRSGFPGGRSGFPGG